MKFAKLFTLLATCVLTAASVGCNGNVHVTGKVTYPDGTPLNVGQIVFTDDFYMGKSDIDKNGEYSIHTYSRNDGIRKGTYRVYITGAMVFETSDDVNKRALAPFRMDKAVQKIDMQYTNPDTTGWVFEVKKNMKLDLIVYPPNEVPEEERTEAAKYFFDEEYRKKVKQERAFQEKEEGKESKPKRHVNPNLL